MPESKSIRWKIVQTVFLKELRDLFRDKIMLAFIVGVPFVIYPASMMVGTELASVNINQEKETRSKIYVYKKGPSEILASIRDSIKKSEELELVEFEKHLELDKLYDGSKPEAVEVKDALLNQDENNPVIEKLIRDRKFDCIVMSQEMVEENQSFSNKHIWLYYDKTSPESKLAHRRLSELLKKFSKEQLSMRLSKNKLPETFITPLPIHDRSVASLKKEISNLIGVALPLILILITIVNVFHPALCLTCSEKENGTLPTLLCTPLHHIEMILGKYFTLLLISVFSLLANSIGLLFGLALGPTSLLLNLTPSFGMMSLIFVLLLPISMFYSALFLCFAILPRTYREGGNYLTPVILISLFPACASLMPMLKLTPMLAMTPVCNVSLLLREILVAPVSLELILLTIGSNLLWTFALLVTASAFFSREDILLGENLKFTDLFTLDRSAFPKLTPGMSVIGFLAIFSVFFYMSFAVQKLVSGMAWFEDIKWIKSSLPLLQSTLIQLTVVMLIPLVITRYFKMNIKTTFHMFMPKGLSMLSAVFLGFSMCVFAAWVSQLIPAPKHVMELLEKTIFGDGAIPWFILFLSVSIAPAFCEEIAFRGFIMRGFMQRLPASWSILLTAILFAFMHFSLYRFLPTFCLGLVLGYAVWKSGSLWVGIVMHAINNGLVVTLHLYQEPLKAWGISSDTQFGWKVSVVMVAMFIFGMVMLHLGQRKPRLG